MITYQNTKTVYDLVQNAGREHGVRVFLRWEENEIIHERTYRQFAEECQAVSAWTKAQDAKAGHKVRVGLLGSSSDHYLAVLLGVMSSGNVSIPLDIQSNVSTLSDCLNRSDVDILFYDWEHYALVEGVKDKCPKIREYISFQHGKHVPCSDQIIQKYSGAKIKPTATEDDCAMVLFTSGTTGRGKGVMLSNRNLMDNTFCTTDTDNPENEVYLSVLPIHHVFCLNGDVFTVMRYGGVLCLNRELSKLAQHIRMFQPSVIRAVPMISKALYNRIAIMARKDPERPLEDIRWEVLGKRLHKIISGGGYLAPELAKNFQNLGISIAQGYGMSECSPKISSPDWSRPDKVASVGRIVDGCEVRIEEGEIQVKSPSVMMGYYKDPEETAKAITVDGWLRTGDIGYVDEEGFLYLTGRLKNLIIMSNGENVAPEQLENMFDDDRLVEEVLVYGEDDAIVAEIYPNFKYADAAGISDINASIADIVSRHNEDLPSFKRIVRFQLRKNPFAKTSSKKIIRSHYFEQKKKEKELRANVRLPENKVQQEIYDRLSGAIGHSLFGIDTNIYDAGLDSLGSVMLLSDIYAQFKLSMTLKDLMSHPTVLELEKFYNEAMKQKRTDYAVREKYPLTNLQLYFAYVMRGNTTANLPFLFKLDPSVDISRLKTAVGKMFDAHPGLKAVIQPDEGVYKNFRYDDKHIDVPIIRLTDAEWEETKNTLLQPFMYTPGEPLFHTGIFLTESANYFFLDVAHIMGDGMTMNVLFEDINTLYAGKPVQGEDEYTFFEYILDEKERDAKGLRKVNEEYFYKLMEGFRIRKSILTRKDCYDLGHGQNAVLKARFGEINRKKLLAFCGRHGVSENVVFLTAFNYCISIFSGEKDTVSTSIHSGRTDSRWSRLAGPLFLTYPFRYTNVPHETVPQLLKKSGRQIMETMECYISTLHADEMFFQYQGEILNIDSIGGAPAERQHIQLDSLPFHLQVMSDKLGYYYELRYWENRMDRQQLEVFMTCMGCIVNAMMDEPSVRRLKKHLPETIFPIHYFIESGMVNKEAGCTLIPDMPSGSSVKAYVFDETCRKQPFGAWGSLYIMDHPTRGWTDQITNPYGPGILYQTGRTARILPDGTMDILENAGRTIMSESLTGRHFLELYRLEKLLCGYEGIERAEACVRYCEGNKFVLTADVYGKNEPDMEGLRAYLEGVCEKHLIPGDIRFIGKA